MLVQPVAALAFVIDLFALLPWLAVRSVRQLRLAGEGWVTGTLAIAIVVYGLYDFVAGYQISREARTFTYWVGPVLSDPARLRPIVRSRRPSSQWRP